MTKPIYFYNGSTFELVGPTTPQSPIAYQTSAPTAPATGDIWIDSDGDVDTYNRQLTRYYFVATAGQTTISGTDANNLTLAYVAGSEAVYVNGALQVRGQDYTATNGTSVVMSSGLAVNDVVEIFAYTAFTVANAYTKTETDGLVSAAAGLKLLTPSSVAVGSGTATINSNGGVTFSGASSVSFNGVFSSTYQNYRIVWQSTNASAAAIRMRLRVSGADDTNNVYVSAYSYEQVGGAGTGRVTDGATTSWTITQSANQTASNAAIDIFRPNEATPTYASFMNMNRDTVDYIYMGGLIMTNSTSFTGITFYPGSSTISGTVSIYGYKV
jgi:hypothetical protein